MTEPVGHPALRSNCENAWLGWPCDEAIEKLRAEVTMAPDLDSRKAIARKIQSAPSRRFLTFPSGSSGWCAASRQA
jgi:peptide/nickel transport system substrate-binding protein